MREEYANAGADLVNLHITYTGLLFSYGFMMFQSILQGVGEVRFPGRYSIKRTLKMKLSGCGPFEVEVTSEGFKKIQWECDSGIR